MAVHFVSDSDFSACVALLRLQGFAYGIMAGLLPKAAPRDCPGRHCSSWMKWESSERMLVSPWCAHTHSNLTHRTNVLRDGISDCATTQNLAQGHSVWYEQQIFTVCVSWRVEVSGGGGSTMFVRLWVVIVIAGAEMSAFAKQMHWGLIPSSAASFLRCSMFESLC